MAFRLHREGTAILIGFALAIMTLIVLAYLFIPFIFAAIIGLLLTVFYGFVVWFFRNPVRTPQVKPHEIVAPVDGKVVEIKEVTENEYFKDKCIQLSIFMSPLNVHVTRYPLSGEVVYSKYHKGKYLVAFHPKSSELNERTTVVVKAKNNQEVLFRQIAGAVARRIVLYTKNQDEAKAGVEYGFIKFGSRLDIFLPLNAKILTKIGNKTRGGEEIIAELMD